MRTLHINTFNGSNHVADLIEVAVLWTAPGRSQPEASRAGGLGALRGGDHINAIHQASCLQPSVVRHALCTVGEIFRTTAGLNAKQACGFDVIWVEIAAMNGVGLK
ncbi:hypothetical protein GGE24_007306 [Bradyrhizobium centrosematis]|nr:hypothetical protein [Bradyrhizobium centrosematis]MCS3777931.1 hypothetical protein [Bradyrhizobium centrosematis]